MAAHLRQVGCQRGHSQVGGRDTRLGTREQIESAAPTLRNKLVAGQCSQLSQQLPRSPSAGRFRSPDSPALRALQNSGVSSYLE